MDYMKKILHILFLSLGFVPLAINCFNADDKSFVIVIPSYNNKLWYMRNLDSIFDQSYDNYRVIYIDDASPDGTGDLVKKYIAKRNMGKKVTLLLNEKNKGALANTYYAANLCKSHEIIVIVDGDDWFNDVDALKYLNEIYKDPNVWMTYGQFVEFPIADEAEWVHRIPSEIVKKNAFRDYTWVSSHLRTFYAALFHKINENDLKKDGTFLPSAGDLAAMFPMLEMAGFHSYYVPRVMYVYNTANQINDHKVRRALQIEMDQLIRSRTKYQPLEYLDEVWDSFFSQHDWSESATKDYPQVFLDAVAVNNKLFDRHFAEANDAWRLAENLYENNVHLINSHRNILRIPMVFHLIWLGGPVPNSYKKLEARLKQFNPRAKVRIWTDEDAAIYPMSQKNRIAFDKAINYGEKSDILRYEILYKEGGIYLDGDFKILRSFEDLFYAYDFFAGMSQNRDFEILNGLMGAVPGHPILKYCVENIKPYDREIHRSALKQSIMERTGPYYLTRNFIKGAQEGGFVNIAFPPNYFYPWPHYQRHVTSPGHIRSMILPYSFTFHEWACSWQSEKKH